MKKFNRADKTLFAAACMFAAALFLKIKYPGNIVADGFLFCTEAALVGGIADWFAVSALFTKPLGIPWHTAILPKRREAFTEATIRLVQRQFFSKKNIFRRMKSFNAVEKIIVWLDDDRRKRVLAGKLHECVRIKLIGFDAGRLSEKWAVSLQKNEAFCSGLNLEKHCRAWLENDSWKQQAIHGLAVFTGSRLSGDEGRACIKAALERFEEEKIKSGVASFWFSLGGAFDVINNDECAELIQEKLLLLIGSIDDTGSEIHAEVLSAVTNAIKEVTDQKVWTELIDALKADILSAEVLAKIIFSLIRELQRQLQDDADMNELKNDIIDIFLAEINSFLAMMRSNAGARHIIDILINDMAGRSALQAQNMAGDVVRRAIGSMSDEQLNEMVYSKIKTDLIWIRMNGSIVGGGIGLVLFVFITLFMNH